jgi:hypothetical protein
MMVTVFKSLAEKSALNFTLSMFVWLLVCDEDPLLWRRVRCSMIMMVAESGARKWSEKNRLRVGCETENLPHIHFTLFCPMYGMAEKMLVITVAPQNDICPHGRTYPKKAEAINTIRITIPLAQV